MPGILVTRKTRKTRWIQTFHNGPAATSTTLTAGRVFLQLFEVLTPSVVDAIVIANGATVDGNVRVGIYGPLATEETAEGAALVVESASTAQAGASTSQTISITATTLLPGRYYLAFQSDSATNTVFRRTNVVNMVGWLAYYDRGGGYGAFTTPCPAVTTGSAALSTGAVIRVQQP